MTGREGIGSIEARLIVGQRGSLGGKKGGVDISGLQREKEKERWSEA